MRFHDLVEVQQSTVQILNKIEDYFSKEGQFREIYPEIWKKIHHVRRENYIYNRGNKQLYAVLVVLQDDLYNKDEEKVEETIKDLEIIKDNNARVERNNLLIKILVPEETE